MRKVRNGSRAGKDKKGQRSRRDSGENRQKKVERSLSGVTAQRGEGAEGEKARPAVDGESWIRPGRDTFEHSEDPEELWCESYEDIMGVVRMVGKWKANILYQIANAILRDYHEKR